MHEPTQRGVVRRRDSYNPARFNGTQEEFETERARIIEAAISEATAELISSSLSREELAVACARAAILGDATAKDLISDNVKLGHLIQDFIATMKALDESVDLDEARAKLKEADLWFNFDRLLNLAQGSAVSLTARKNALARYSKPSPMNDAKAFVFECWERWEENKSQYSSTAAFARAMLDKFPETLTSQPVIERWVRSWRSR